MLITCVYFALENETSRTIIIPIYLAYMAVFMESVTINMINRGSLMSSF